MDSDGRGKSILRLTTLLLFLLIASTFPQTLQAMIAPEKRASLIDPSEWAFRNKGIRVHIGDMWNYDPFWYDLLSRSEMHKRSHIVRRESAENEEGSEKGKRLFVARIGKRKAHMFMARIG